MADNTKQFRYSVMIEGGIDALFADQDDVFVAGDLLWYPVEGMPKIRAEQQLRALGVVPQNSESPCHHEDAPGGRRCHFLSAPAHSALCL